MNEKYYIKSASGLTHGPFDDASELGAYYRNTAWIDGSAGVGCYRVQPMEDR